MQSDCSVVSVPSTSPQSRRVSLEEILSHEYIRQRGHYIEVKIVHSFLANWGNHVECHFVLADHKCHISAVSYRVRIKETGEREVPFAFQALKEGTIQRIEYFEVEKARRHCLGVHGRMESKFILRDQLKRLKLRNCASDFVRIYDATADLTCLRNIPLKITRLHEISESHYRGRFVDLQGFVHDVEMKFCSRTQQPYKIVYLTDNFCESMDSRTKEKIVPVAVFGTLVQKNLNCGSLYAFTNVFVNDNPLFSLSLQTQWRSIIVEVNSQSQKYQSIPHNDNFTKEVFTNVNCDIKSEAELSDQFENEYQQHDENAEFFWDWDDDGEDECLSHVFSQLTKLEPETVSASQTVTMQLKSSVPRMEPEPIILRVSDSCEAPKTSPSKRTLSLPLSPTSPPKKLRPNSPLQQEGTATEVDVKSQSVVSYFSQQYSQQLVYDCVNQTQPYKVVVTPALEYKDTDKSCYFMRSKIRGLALIIHNNFPGTDKERKGSYFDVLYLDEFLTQCNFKVTTKRNVTSLNFRSVIENFKQQISEIGASNFDSLLVAVLSHGVNGMIEMTDGVYIPLFDDIIHPFNETSFPDLQGKPKIFLVQACQNLPTMNEVRMHRNILTPPVKTKLNNVIVCYGTNPGAKAYRDHHLVEMLEMVQHALDNVKINEPLDLTCTWNPFKFKKFYFNPGL